MFNRLINSLWLLCSGRALLRGLLPFTCIALSVGGNCAYAADKKTGPDEALREQLSQLSIVTEEFPPFSFTNAKGEVDGLATEVVKEIMHRLDMDQPIQVKPWARAYRETVYGNNNLLFSVSYTEKRAPLFQWVGSLYTLRSNLYAKSGSGIRIRSIEDAKRQSAIGSYRDSMDAQLLKAQGVDNLAIVTSNVQNVHKLMLDRVPVIAASDITLPEMAKQAGYRMEDLEMLYTFATTEGYLVFSRSVSADVVNLWRETLQEMRNEGELLRIQKKWCPTNCW
jgi:polar amino acid transport system substrate-binding protein